MLLSDGYLGKWIDWPHVEAYITQAVSKKKGDRRNREVVLSNFGNVASRPESLPNISSAALRSINCIQQDIGSKTKYGNEGWNLAEREELFEDDEHQ